MMKRTLTVSLALLRGIVMADPRVRSAGVGGAGRLAHLDLDRP